MRTTLKSITTLLVALLLCGPAWAAETESAPRLADGNSWKSSSKKERIAYIVGISEVISVGVQYDKKKVPGNSRTFMRKAYKGLSSSSIPQAMTAVDKWYEDHPDQLAKPVIAVLWITLAEPNL